MRIALLTTGDELIQGTILNSNSRYIAHRLTELGYGVGDHLSCSDDQSDLSKAIRYLLAHHQVVIITGGLGPTSDDRTRFALAEVIGKPLILNQACWAILQQRLAHLGQPQLQSNQQQALFPEGAAILSNPHGTAAGCKIITATQQIIYMLPGPPKENIPMLETQVLPDLQSQYHAEQQIHHWRLFGVGESQISPLLDQLVQPYGYKTGFRWHYPYIDFKVATAIGDNISTLAQSIEELIAPYRICQYPETASSTFINTLLANPRTLCFNDGVTGGLLQTALLTRETFPWIKFHSPPQSAADIVVTLCGLNEYWQSKQTQNNATTIELSLQHGKTITQRTLPIPYRNAYVRDYVVEIVCHETQQFFRCVYADSI